MLVKFKVFNKMATFQPTKPLNKLFLLLSLYSTIMAAEATKVNADNPAIDGDWWKHAVFYQIYPRSFMDSNGDGIGDLKGITSKLSYLADLGITATWLSPIFESPMVDFGYDISNFTAIQREYGTMADFEELMAEAKRLGIKIILDFVPNHSSDQCEWFLKSAAREPGFEDFYVWADGKTNAKGEREPPNNWRSVFFGSAWTWHKQRQQYYLHQFAAAQPDLNYRNPRVVELMDNVLNFWLNKGVSGFRIDAITHLFEDATLRDEPLSGRTNDSNSFEYLKHVYTKDLPETFNMVYHWRQFLDAYTVDHGGPARVIMTEAYSDLKAVMEYYENEHGVVGSHIPFNFNFFALKPDSDARDFVSNIQQWLTYMPRGHVANWVLGNHDNPRVASRFGAERVDAMNILLMMLPGVAVTYMGEEIGMQDYRDISWEQTVDPWGRNAKKEQYKTFSRDPERTPFQWNDSPNAGFSTASSTWLPVHPNYKQLNVAQQQAAPKSHYKLYKRLLKLRQDPTLKYGKLELEVLNRHVFALKRTFPEYPTVLVLINVSEKPQELHLKDLLTVLPAQLDVLLASTNSNYKPNQVVSTESLQLTPYEGLICEL